jgi:sialidase-1
MRPLYLALLATFLTTGTGPEKPAPPEHVPVFVAGSGGYHTYRIPALIVSPKGTLLAFCEGRKTSARDSGDIDVVLRRSSDGGKTWQPLQVVADAGPDTIGNPCPVVDRTTGTIWLPLTRNRGDEDEKLIRDGKSKAGRTVWLTKSTDDGATWSEPVEITKQVSDPQWTWYASGPGCGIQLKTGRLVVPCDHTVLGNRQMRSHVIYSDDHGATWKLGGVAGDQTNECQVVERDDGSLLLNMRSYHKKNLRAVATSKDGGLTWSPVTLDETLVEPVCQASLVRYGGKGRVLFANPASTKREKLTVRLSYDDGATWPVAKLLHAGPAAYSALAVLPDGRVGCLYERGTKSAYEEITFARFALDWLEDGPEPVSVYQTRTVAGFTVLVHPKVLEHKAEAAEGLALLAEKLNEIARILPADKLKPLLKVKVWVEWQKKKNGAAEYHVSETWLKENGYPAEKVRGVEISNLRNFVSWTRAPQPMMILHELAHAYHHTVLPNGYDNAAVSAAYKAAMERRLYDLVPYVSGGLRPGYARCNAQEYFAELTEAYFGLNDFFPFHRAELREHDAQGYKLMQEVWGKRDDAVKLTVVNETGKEVAVYWQDGTNLKTVGKIAAKGQLELNTFVGHRFVAIVSEVGTGKAFTAPGFDTTWRVR